jgi:multisubunit Na+/H+ antiporter MnhC subunit
MSKQRSTRRPRKRQANRPTNGDRNPHEERSAEAITVAWTASVTSVFLADLVTIAGHFYARSHPESKTALPFEAIMLLTACVMGLASLSLLLVVWRVSRLKPPPSFVVFATLVAAAPMVVTIARLTMR